VSRSVRPLNPYLARKKLIQNFKTPVSIMLMKCRLTIIGLSALLALVVYPAFLGRGATSATKSLFTIAPDGTVVDLRNDFAFAAMVPKSSTKTPLTVTPAGKE